MGRTVVEARDAHRTGYLVTTALLAIAGGALVVGGGARADAVAAGLALAWSVQAASFWPLAGALEAGRPATAAWVAGMAARFGGLAALWAMAGLAGLNREIVLSYAFALVTFLILEAVWLALTLRIPPPGRIDR